MKLVPLGERVVLQRVEAENQTASGILIPGQSKEKPAPATVVAVGPGKIVDGKSNMLVKPGDVVIIAKFSGTELKLEDEEYIVVNQNDILAIVE